MPLTPAQRRVVELVADGYTNKQIAAKLGISHVTAKKHVWMAVRRLPNHNPQKDIRVQITRYVLEHHPPHAAD